MSSFEPVGLAIVGAGNIAHVHAEAITQVPEARLVAVCARNVEQGRSLAGEYQARVYSSVDEMLVNAEVDGVLVATPSGVHQEAILPALRAGRHVLCEKPLEISVARIEPILRESEISKTLLAGFFPIRYSAGAQAIRQAARAGRFGTLSFLSARVKWWRKDSYYRESNWRGRWDLDGGGALMNQGIHAVDLLQWIGGRTSRVTAVAKTLVHKGIQVEDTLAATVEFAGGAVGTIEAATSCYPGLDLSLEVSGSAGTAILVRDQIVFWEFAEERPEDRTMCADPSVRVGGGAADPKAISNEGHRQQIEMFCRAVRGEKSEIIDGREASQSVALVEAIYRSARSGRAELVKDMQERCVR